MLDISITVICTLLPFLVGYILGGVNAINYMLKDIESEVEDGNDD